MLQRFVKHHEQNVGRRNVQMRRVHNSLLRGGDGAQYALGKLQALVSRCHPSGCALIPKPTLYTINTRVRALHQGKYHDGTIASKNDDGTYMVTVDGTVFQPEKIIPLFDIRTRVLAKMPDWKRMYVGTIAWKNDDGTYHVLFDDDDEQDVDWSNIEIRGRPPPPPASVNNRLEQIIQSRARAQPPARRKSRRNAKVQLAVCTRVLVKLPELDKKSKGTIVKKNEDGTYTILFDDGDLKEKVNPFSAERIPNEPEEDLKRVKDKHEAGARPFTCFADL